MDEFSFIEKYLSPLTFGKKEALGLKDDAALLPSKPGFDLVITKDALVESTHFFKGDEPYFLAKKLLRVNLSDLAAKGAEGYCCFLALVLPRDVKGDWFAAFASGLKDDMEKFGVFLAGGDTTSHDGPLALSLTAIGLVPSGSAILRKGTKIGDGVFVTGTIGDSYLGLTRIGAGNKHELDATNRYYLPQPRMEVGKLLRGVASACADISDGLLADLGHICECSSSGAKVLLEDIPFSEEVRKEINTDSGFAIKAVTGGDDYELVFVAAPEKENDIIEISRKTGTAITKIGVITNGNKVKLLADGQEIEVNKFGYKHSIGK